MSLRGTNTAAVAKYIEHRPSYLESSTQTHDEPMRHKARGASRPPIPERAFAWLDDGLYFHERKGEGKTPVKDHHVALKYQSALNAVVESYRHGREAQGGVSLSRIVEDAWRDPVAVPTWQTARGAEWAAFRSLCSRVAGDFGGLYPSVEIGVELHPGDERLVKPGAPHHRNRRLTVEDSYRRRYEKLRLIEGAEDITRSAAVETLAQLEGVSPATIWRCVRFREQEIQVIVPLPESAGG